MSDIKPIETRYAGCRFRSRLEARWAVFFDRAGVRWEYEPQGFVVDGRPYLPDFLLTDCGTWVEVKGNDKDLDQHLMCIAAMELPVVEPRGGEQGPRLLILGPHPVLPEPYVCCEVGDWGWIGLTPESEPDPNSDGDPWLHDAWYGFGMYRKNRRPWLLGNTSQCTPVAWDEGSWLLPALDPVEPGVPDVYIAARSARFEHGEFG